MKDMKKEFQKAVKAFRDTLPDVIWHLSGGIEELHRPEYPKAMMTASQIRKGTATINCMTGHVDEMMNFPQFVAWCKEWGIKKVVTEVVKYPYGSGTMKQIRIYFPTADEIKKLNEEIAAEEMQNFIDAGYLD